MSLDLELVLAFVGAALAAAPSAVDDAADVPKKGGGDKPRPYDDTGRVRRLETRIPL